MATVGELVYKITGELDGLKKAVADSEKEIEKLKKGVDKVDDSGKKTSSTFGKLTTILKGVAAAYVTKKIIDFARESVELASARFEQETKLAQVLRISTNATDDQIRAVKEQATALEKVGVVNRDVILASQAQLATFDLQTESIQKLTPSILNYLVAERGVNATRQDAISLTNGLAQALQGNFGTLSKSGFVLDEHTKQMIANGTETERVTALAKVLDSTYEGLNETMANTFLGTQIRVKRELQSFKEDLGFALMPAINLFAGEIFRLSGEFSTNADRINTWGKALYQAAQVLLVITRSFETFARAVITGSRVIQTGVQSATKAVVDFSIRVKKVLGKDTEDLKTLSDGLAETINETAKKGVESSDKLTKSFLSLGDAMSQALDPTGFEPVSEAQIAAYDAMRKSNNAFGDDVAESAKELEQFQKQMVGFVDESVKVREALEKNLTESFKKFGETISETFKDTQTKLADIVLGAEEKIASLRQRLAKENDAERQQDILKEIQGQEEILRAREGFEQRQAEKLEQVRARLTEAGIDPTSIEGLQNIRTFEEQLAEQRRLASLDEFTRFEEQQFAKIDRLTQDFITEVQLTEQKIQKQKDYEEDLTSFLKNTTQVRIDEVDRWAKTTIAAHQQVANSLRSLISLQSQVQSTLSRPQFHTGGMVGASGGEVHSGEYVIPARLVSKFSGVVSALERARTGSSVDNSRTINAPININANVQDEVDFRAISRELAWELGRS